MKKLFNFLVLFMMITSTAWAQDKKSYTLEDVMPGGNNFYNLQPKNISGLKWWGDVCIKGGADQLVTVNTKNGKEETLLTLADAQEALTAHNLGKIRHLQGAFMPYKEEQVVLTTSTHRVLMDVKTKEIIWSVLLPAKAENFDWSKESRSLAYTIDNNVYVMTADGKQHQISDEPYGVFCGKTVHRDEFGVKKGTFWSPKGDLLAFYRQDESMVTEFPQVDMTPRVAKLAPQRYPMAGMTSHKVTVGVYNPTTQKTIFLKAGDPTNRYFTNLCWSPDGKKIYLIELNRDQNHSQLVRYDATTGEKEAMLYEERHPKYVEPQTPITFLPWDDNQFIYQSQKDGFNHLYLFDTTGKEIRQITKGEWLVQELLGFNTKTKEIIIMSTESSPLRSNAFAVNFKTGKTRMIGEEDGVHHVQLSKSGKYVIDSHVSSIIGRKIDIWNVSGKGKGLNLLTAEDPLEASYELPEIKVGTIKAADGKTDLYYRLIKPVNFDPNKKYPAIIYVYGGPHAQLITDTRQYGARGWDIYMAQQGYVMLTVDNRGSKNRGLEFENVIFRQLGTEEMKDQMKGVELLKSLNYVDQNRLGVHGWSFGGFMTTNLMLTHNDVFKVGVAGGPVINWSFYEVMYGERYMDSPQSNPEGYKKNNLLLRAGDLKGRLQIIIGGNDPICVPQHSYRFLRACIDAGTQPDYFIYPGDEHNMFGRDRVHLYTRITRYFEDHLK